jgi:GrpB-like predicted nucleotidyltransferase (UPF0157 family)
LPLVVPYDPEWAVRFEVESAMLERVLAGWLDGGIHHVGSTAVPGLAAKPVIDIIVGVRDLNEAGAASEALGVLDYASQGKRPEAHAFFKPSAVNAPKHTHHLFLTEPGSAIWHERLAVRDALRADRSLVEAYAAWKGEHAEGTGAEDPYTGDKRAFVRRLLAGRRPPIS